MKKAILIITAALALNACAKKEGCVKDNTGFFTVNNSSSSAWEIRLDNKIIGYVQPNSQEQWQTIRADDYQLMAISQTSGQTEVMDFTIVQCRENTLNIQ